MAVAVVAVRQQRGGQRQVAAQRRHWNCVGGGSSTDNGSAGAVAGARRQRSGGGNSVRLRLAVDACRAMEQHLATNDGTIIGGGLGTRGGLTVGGRNTQCNNQPDKRGPTRGRCVMRGEGRLRGQTK
jgi:hypothetical protein